MTQKLEQKKEKQAPDPLCAGYADVENHLRELGQGAALRVGSGQRTEGSRIQTDHLHHRADDLTGFGLIERQNIAFISQDD